MVTDITLILYIFSLLANELKNNQKLKIVFYVNGMKKCILSEDSVHVIVLEENAIVEYVNDTRSIFILVFKYNNRSYHNPIDININTPIVTADF